MDKIFEPNSNFDFNRLSLGHPQTTKGGSYFTKLQLDNQNIYIQFPKCKTKQGITQSEKIIYTDLLYETAYNNELNEWLENLESSCQKLLFEKNNLWFSGDIDLSDIESAFTNVAKMYKSGKQFLIRCYIPKPQTIKIASNCFVYDENENPLHLNDVDVTKEIIPLVKIDGIKFTSKSFQLELILAQIMVMKEQEEFKQCLIKPTPSSNQIIQNNLSSRSLSFSKDKVNETNDISGNTLFSNKEVVSISFPTNVDKPNIIEQLNISEDEEEEEDDEEEEDEEEEEVNDDNKSSVGKYENKEYNKNSEHMVEVEHLEINEFVPSPPKYIYNNETKTITTNNPETSLDIKSGLKEIVKDNSLDEIKKDGHLELVNLNMENVNDFVKLRKPNEVYYEIYKAAREKAKRAKRTATEAYLEAKNIKIKFMLDDLDESDDDEIYSESN
jgi:hypothetical protein